MGHSPQISHPGSGRRLRRGVQATAQSDGHTRSPHGSSFAVAKWTCRALDRIDPKRVPGPSYCFQRGAPAPRALDLCQLLQRYPHALIPRQRRSIRSRYPTRRPDPFRPSPRRSASFLDPDKVFGRDNALTAGNGRWAGSSIAKSAGQSREIAMQRAGEKPASPSTAVRGTIFGYRRGHRGNPGLVSM